MQFFLCHHLFLFLSLVGGFVWASHGAFQFRSPTDDEIKVARRILLEQAMNPLSLSKENLLMAFDDNDDGGNGPILGFGQIRPLNDEYAELASLYVVPERRKQGIGSALVEALMARQETNNQKQQVCLLTLKPTTNFYETLGFEISTDEHRKELPMAIQLEYKAGNAISFLLGNELVCMVQKKDERR